MKRNWYAAQTFILWCCGWVITIWLIKLKSKFNAGADLLCYFLKTFSFGSEAAGQRDLSDLEIIFDSTRRLKELNFPNCCGVNRVFGLKHLKLIWKIIIDPFCLVKFAIYLAAWDNKLGHWPSIRVKKCNKTQNLQQDLTNQTYLSPSVEFVNVSTVPSAIFGSFSLVSAWLLASCEVTSILGTGRELLLFLGWGSVSGEKFRPFSLLWR